MRLVRALSCGQIRTPHVTRYAQSCTDEAWKRGRVDVYNIPLSTTVCFIQEESSGGRHDKQKTPLLPSFFQVIYNIFDSFDIHEFDTNSNNFIQFILAKLLVNYLRCSPCVPYSLAKLEKFANSSMKFTVFYLQ